MKNINNDSYFLNDDENDDDLQEMRAEARTFVKNLNENALKTWFEEIGFNGTIAYHNDLSKHVFKIYANLPGALIGKGGQNARRFEGILNEVFMCYVNRQHCLEVSPPFSFTLV